MRWGDRFQARVSRGAALLDRSVPMWEGWIDTSSLNVRSAQKCVLGQLARKRFDARDYHYLANRLRVFRLVHYGFASWGRHDRTTTEWRKEIHRRELATSSRDDLARDDDLVDA